MPGSGRTWSNFCQPPLRAISHSLSNALVAHSGSSFMPQPTTGNLHVTLSKWMPSYVCIPTAGIIAPASTSIVVHVLLLHG